MLTYKDFDQTSSVFKVFRLGWFTVYEWRTIQRVNCLKKKKKETQPSTDVIKPEP